MMYNDINFDTYFRNYPDQNGYFGRYGGVYISEELKKPMAEITEAYYTLAQSRKFIAELRRIRKEFQGRPTPISHLERLSNALGNVQLYVKPNTWAKRRSLQKPVPVNTVLRWLPPLLTSAWSAIFTWALWTSRSRLPM